MKYIVRVSLLVAFTLILGTAAYANIGNKSYNKPDSTFNNTPSTKTLDLQIRHPIITLETPILSSKNSVKVAGVRFVGDSMEEGFYHTGSMDYQCPPMFSKTCSAPAVGGGASCGGKYEKCICPAEYRYKTEADCPNGQIPDASIPACDGKYKACGCSPMYKETCSGANVTVKTNAIACNGKYKESDCQCPADWFTTISCPSPKELGGKTCQAYSGATKMRETCSCPSSYVRCDNGPELANTPSCKNTSESFTRYTKCKQPVVTCESSIKEAKPDYKIIKTIAELKASSMSGSDLVILNDIAETSSNGTNGIYIGNNTKIHSAKTIASTQCPDTKLTLDIINLNGKSTINATIDSFKIEYSTAEVVASKEVKTKDVIINSGTNKFSTTQDGKLVATVNTLVKAGIFDANNLNSEAVQVDKGASFTLSGNGRVESTLNVNAGANLSFYNANYTLNILNLTGDTTAGNTTVKLTNSTVYTKEKNKNVTTNIGHFETLNAQSWKGTNFEMTLNNSTFDMRNSKFLYSGNSSAKPFIIRLQNGSKFLNMSGVVFWGGNGVQFIFDPNSNSQMTITGTTGTGTCTASSNSVVKPKTNSQSAYIKLMNESVMVFVCALGNNNNKTDYFCERYAYCNNISGYTDTCEYTNNTKPKYAVSSCASCTRFSSTYYANLGSNCKKDCCAEWSDYVYQQCPSDYNNSGYKPCRYSALMTYNSCKSSSYGQVSGYCQADYENLSNYYN